METIYRVTTEGDCEGKSTREIAYAKGNQKDILRFYDSVKMYEIHLTEIIIKNITPEMAETNDEIVARTKKLDEERNQLLSRLNTISNG